MNFTELNKIVINLPERTERLKEFKQELVYLPCSNLQIVSGVKHTQSFKGIAQAHLNAILIAKGNEWHEVLIMEDDCVFNGKDQTYDYLLNALNDIPADWDILLGGIYHGKIVPFNNYWSKTGEFCGLHFYIVNSKAYDNILEWDGTQHIDRFMNLKGLRLNAYVTNKFIATQRDGWSDNQGKKIELGHILKSNKYKLL